MPYATAGMSAAGSATSTPLAPRKREKAESTGSAGSPCAAGRKEGYPGLIGVRPSVLSLPTGKRRPLVHAADTAPSASRAQNENMGHPLPEDAPNKPFFHRGAGTAYFRATAALALATMLAALSP